MRERMMAANAVVWTRAAAVTEDAFGRATTEGIKGKSVRGGGITVLARALMFALQMGSSVVLARLLSPEDFGLQSMVVAMTGFLGLFRDMGLGVATVQREVLTREQASTLFWMNVACGALLAIVAAAMAPVIVILYGDPRLFSITTVSATAFVVNSLTIQHQALLNRSMRFVAVAQIELIALTVSIVVGIGMAMNGFGYWALVGMALSAPVVTMVAVWMALPWLPGRPRWGTGVRSSVHFGAAATLNNVVVYAAYNAEKVLLGRVWGAEALGLYSRAYQLVNLPVQQLYFAIGGVAFPALSRAQGDVAWLRRSFLKGYSLIVSIAIPLTICSALFADEIVEVMFGPRWIGAGELFRLLAPAVLVFALINPLGWLLLATGRVRRSLGIAFLIAPVAITGVVYGLRYGPAGVATGYSAAMTLLVVPVIGWALYGTGITVSDYWKAVRSPLVSGVCAGVCGWLLKLAVPGVWAPVVLLGIGMTVTLSAYVWMALVVMKQYELYAGVIRQVVGRTRVSAPK